MKFVKWALIVVVALVALATIVGFLSPKVAHMERTKLISADSAIVFGLVDSPTEFRKWSPWTEKDPKMSVETFGPERGVGSGFSWKSNVSDVGNGTWKVSQSHPYKHVGIDLTLDFGKPTSNFNLLAKGEKTELTWSLDVDNGMNPFGRLFGLFLESMVSPDYEKGLENLETAVLKLPKGRVASIDVISMEERYALSLRMTVPSKQVGAALGQMFPIIMSYLNENKIAMAGTPFTLYHHWDPQGVTDLAAGIVIAKPHKGNDRFKPLTLPKSTVVVASYYGPYDKIGVAYNAIDAWAKENNKVLDQSPWEEYITDPASNPDPQTWLTKVCFVVK